MSEAVPEVAVEAATALPTPSQLFRQYRERKDLNPTEASGQIGITFSALESYERGRRVPRPVMLVRIFDQYGLSEDEQFDLLQAIVRLRPTTYRWVEALIEGGSECGLILKTLRGYAVLGGDGAMDARNAVPIPPRKFPPRS